MFLNIKICRETVSYSYIIVNVVLNIYGPFLIEIKMKLFTFSVRIHAKVILLRQIKCEIDGKHIYYLTEDDNCRFISNAIIPNAVPTFKLSTLFSNGIFTRTPCKLSQNL